MHISAKRVTTLIALALLVSAACESPTPVAPAESGLSISANPTRIAVDGNADITVIARKADGSSVNEGTEINFSTSLGSISPLLATTNDRGLASAVLTGGGDVGLATVEASSGAAAPVTLEIQIGSQPVSMTLQANPPRISKEGGDSTLVASVFDELGNSIPDVAVSFTTEAGTLASGGRSVDTDSNGDADDLLTLTSFDVAGVREGFFLVMAETVGSDGLPLIAEFEIEVGGFVESVSLNANPGTVPASGGEFLLTAFIQDDGGNAVEGADVLFSTDVGSLASSGRPQASDSDGVAIDTLIISAIDLDAFTGSVINVSASTSGLGNEEIIGTDQILISTSVGILTLDASQLTIPSDMDSSISLTATVFDDTGAAVSGIGVSFFQTSTCLVNLTCSAGDLANPGLVVTNTLGQAPNTLTITAAQIEDPVTMTQDTATITVTAEGILLGQTVTDSVTITVVPP